MLLMDKIMSHAGDVEDVHWLPSGSWLCIVSFCVGLRFSGSYHVLCSEVDCFKEAYKFDLPLEWTFKVFILSHILHCGPWKNRTGCCRVPSLCCCCLTLLSFLSRQHVKANWQQCVSHLLSTAPSPSLRLFLRLCFCLSVYPTVCGSFTTGVCASLVLSVFQCVLSARSHVSLSSIIF